MTLMFRGVFIFVTMSLYALAVRGQSLLFPGHYYHNRILAAQQWYPQLRGDQLRIAIKDENIDTQMLDLRDKVFFQELALTSKGDHATQLAYLVAGTGITGDHPLGLAPGAGIYNTSFRSLLPDQQRLKTWGISTQLFAYGTDVENYYGLEAALYDAAAVSDTTLLYVFSAGNLGLSRATGGKYDTLVGWSNLTGNFKQSKNSLVVGASGMNDQLLAFSSRGPAYDGRIKPEITAFSENGTSEAAAVVAGSVLLLQDLYRQKYGVLPSSALVRSALLSAAIKTNGNISHASGYGGLDLLRTLRVIDKEQFFYGALAPADSVVFRVRIPPVCRNLTITLSWIDPPAKAGEGKALINDLDISCYNRRDGSLWLPNVLPIDPVPSMLLTKPKPGEDHLNNNEQLFIANPSDTLLEIKVKTAAIQSGGKQAFYISYAFDGSLQAEWLTPANSDIFYDSTGIFLSWTGDTQTKGPLFYEDTTGAVRLLQSAITGNSLFWKPEKPETGKFRFRLWQGSAEIVSPWIRLQPLPQLQTVSVCGDSVFVEWQSSIPRRITWVGDITQAPWKPLRGYSGINQSYTWISKADMIQQPLWIILPVTDQRYEKSSLIRSDMDMGQGCLTEYFTATPGSNKISLSLKLSSVTAVDSIQIQHKQMGSWRIVYSGKAQTTEIGVQDLSPLQGINQYRAVIFPANRNPIPTVYAETFFFGQSTDLFYPNPVRIGSPLYLAFKEPGKRKVTLLDGNGRVLHSFSADAAAERWILPVLAAGIYFVRIDNGNEVLLRQLLVQ